MMKDGGYIDLGNVLSQQQAASSNSLTVAEIPEIPVLINSARENDENPAPSETNPSS